MTLHHIFATQNFRDQCCYCGNSFSDKEWVSVHLGSLMYKAIPSCHKCGRNIMLPVDFKGSGHDNWDGKNSWTFSREIKLFKTKKKIKSLESKIKILSEKSYP